MTNKGNITHFFSFFLQFSEIMGLNRGLDMTIFLNLKVESLPPLSVYLIYSLVVAGFTVLIL